MSQPLSGSDPVPPVDPTMPLPLVGGAGAAPAPAGTTPAGYPPPPYYGPVSGIPASGVPASGVPASGVPASGGPQAYPGPVYSGAPLEQPMSGPPGSGLPYGAPPPSGGGKTRKVLVLSVVVALLFTVGAVMTGLFVIKSNELTRTDRQLTGQVADRDTRITADGQEIERLKRDLQAATDRIKAVEQDLTGTKNDRDEQARQKAVIANCLDLFSTAMTASSQAAFDKAIKEAEKVCDEADGYL
jgi:hypothetical protein